MKFAFTLSRLDRSRKYERTLEITTNETCYISNVRAWSIINI